MVFLELVYQWRVRSCILLSKCSVGDCRVTCWGLYKSLDPEVRFIIQLHVLWIIMNEMTNMRPASTRFFPSMTPHSSYWQRLTVLLSCHVITTLLIPRCLSVRRPHVARVYQRLSRAPWEEEEKDTGVGGWGQELNWGIIYCVHRVYPCIHALHNAGEWWICVCVGVR